MNKRIQSIDIARGIAMISIMLGHLGAEKINRIVFTYHLPIFYVLSGYFINEKMDRWTFIKKKFQHLIIPYFVICLMIVVFSIPISKIQGMPVSEQLSRWILASLYAAGDDYMFPFAIPKIGAIWFLWATFWGEVCLKMIAGWKKWVQIPFVLGIFSVCCYTSKIIWLPLSIQAGGCALLYMYIGYLIKQCMPYIPKKIPFVYKALFTFIAFGIWIAMIRHFTSFWLVHCDIGHGWPDILGSLCGCYILLLVSMGIEKTSKSLTTFLSWTGKYSLLFLALHIFELNLFSWSRIWFHVFHTDLTDIQYLWFRIFGKAIWIYGMLFFLYRRKWVRRVFCYQPTDWKKS